MVSFFKIRMRLFVIVILVFSKVWMGGRMVGWLGDGWGVEGESKRRSRIWVIIIWYNGLILSSVWS